MPAQPVLEERYATASGLQRTLRSTAARQGARRRHIFPATLLKNFGVTRHNRVVFYDYDEIVYMTECNFRRIPAPRNHEEEMSAEPYYSIGPHDVFPEQFGGFLVSDARMRAIFLEYHRDLIDPEFWIGNSGDRRRAEEEFFPYPRVALPAFRNGVAA